MLGQVQQYFSYWAKCFLTIYFPEHFISTTWSHRLQISWKTRFSHHIDWSCLNNYEKSETNWCCGEDCWVLWTGSFVFIDRRSCHYQQHVSTVELLVKSPITLIKTPSRCPEFGGTVGYFAVDKNSIEYLRQTSIFFENFRQCRIPEQFYDFRS
jgi:hypothetical protein